MTFGTSRWGSGSDRRRRSCTRIAFATITAADRAARQYGGQADLCTRCFKYHVVPVTASTVLTVHIEAAPTAEQTPQ